MNLTSTLTLTLKMQDTFSFILNYSIYWTNVHFFASSIYIWLRQHNFLYKYISQGMNRQSDLIVNRTMSSLLHCMPVLGRLGTFTCVVAALTACINEIYTIFTNASQLKFRPSLDELSTVPPLKWKWRCASQESLQIIADMQWFALPRDCAPINFLKSRWSVNRRDIPEYWG